MALKSGALGLLIYLSMGAYLAALVLMVARRRRAGDAAFGAGCAVAIVACLVRWHETGHVPMQNLFEVFLCLGMLAFPLSVFCRRALGARDGAVDAAIGIALLFPAGFVFSAEPQALPPALQSPLFVPHVAAYMAAYVLLLKAAVPAARVMLIPSADADETLAYRLVRAAFPLLTLGLILGAWWAKLAWGDYWSWDPKELWSLATWLVYVGYLHFRSVSNHRYARLNAAFVLAGTAGCGLTLLWVNLARGLFSGMHMYGT